MDISVVVTSYNYDMYLERCIRSLLNQSIQRTMYEVIVVDDKSEDHSLEILKNFSDQITLHVNEKNMGLPYSANVGIKSARGQFIVRVDADDFVHAEFLYMLYTSIVLEPDYHAVACDYYTTDRFGNKLKRCSASSIPIACGIMYHKDALFDIGLYDECMLCREDEDLRYRFLKQYEILYLPVALYRYRDHEMSLSKNHEMMNLFGDKLKDKKYE